MSKKTIQKKELYKEKENILDYADKYRTSILKDLDARMKSGSCTAYDRELYKKISSKSNKEKTLKLAANI